ncbi:hypothetical protein EJB05_42006, partial [Eragrostis curvula]
MQPARTRERAAVNSSAPLSHPPLGLPLRLQSFAPLGSRSRAAALLSSHPTFSASVPPASEVVGPHRRVSASVAEGLRAPGTSAWRPESTAVPRVCDVLAIHVVMKRVPHASMVDTNRHLLKMRAAALVVCIASWVFAWLKRRVLTPGITYGSMLERDINRMRTLAFIYSTDDTNCVEQLRMRRAPFMQLCDLFRARELLRDSIHSPIEEQVACFLHVVGHNQRFRVAKLTFKRSIETISRYFQEVLYVIGELREEMIRPPATSVHPKILGSRRWYPYFK